MINAILSAAMLAVFGLLYGAFRLWTREGFGQKPLLMAAAALVILLNIVIWAVPNDDGRSLLNEAEKARSDAG